MEKEITFWDEHYKMKWDKQQRHPKCEENQFTRKVGDKVRLKKRKANKWSTAHEKDIYEIIEKHGSTITARHKSDGHTISRDSSKFKCLRESRDESWRKPLLRKPEHNQKGQTNRTELEITHTGRDDRREDATVEEIDQGQPKNSIQILLK